VAKKIVERVKRSDQDFQIYFPLLNQYLGERGQFCCWTFHWTLLRVRQQPLIC
jgi:hypothetical protein